MLIVDHNFSVLALRSEDRRSVPMTKFGIGQAVRRVEDGRFTTGTGQYVGDVALARPSTH